MPSLGRKRRTTRDEDVDEPSPEPATQRRRSNPPSDDEDDGYGGESRSGMNETDLGEMVKKMVRLALACEYARRPIRRQEISEKVLGTSGRQFRKVFEETQVQLRRVFGMQMVELPAKERHTIQQRRAAQKSEKQNKAAASWILQSTLPPKFRQQEVDIISPPTAPTAEEETKYVGICTFVVSLLLLYGGTLSDAKMSRYLRRVGLEDKTPVQGYEETEKLYKRMEKDGYIVKVKESAGTGVGEDEIFWVVGPRGHVEIGEQGARGFALAVYGELPDAAEADLKRRIDKSLAMNDRPAPTQPQQQNGGEKKKRGRKRKSNPQEDEEQEEDTRNGAEEDDEEEEG